MPFYIVYVPKSPIADVDQVVGRNLSQNVPFGFGLGYGLDF
jgi:hypothetical protein